MSFRKMQSVPLDPPEDHVLDPEEKKLWSQLRRLRSVGWDAEIGPPEPGPDGLLSIELSIRVPRADLQDLLGALLRGLGAGDEP